MPQPRALCDRSKIFTCSGPDLLLIQREEVAVFHYQNQGTIHNHIGTIPDYEEFSGPSADDPDVPFCPSLSSLKYLDFFVNYSSCRQISEK
jgi:hypothetical protein